MHLTTAHLPKFCKSLEDALHDQKEWLAFHNEIQLLSAYDLHFFDSPSAAADFQLFNHHNEKEVTLLPVDALLGYVQDSAREQLKEGKPFNHIEIDDERVLGYYADLKFNKTLAELEELLDQHDWKNAVYQPVQMPVDGVALSEILHLFHQSFTVEQLARFATTGQRAAERVQEMVTRHWTNTPMEKFIPDVLSGNILQQFINHEHKTTSMTQKNLEFLQKQLKDAGFNESIFPELEKNMAEGKEKFELKDQVNFGKDQLSATLHFARSKQDGSDMYFFNRYDANLKNQSVNTTQTFFINNKGQSIDLAEAKNLLNGRSVYKELTPKDGDKYRAWLKLDFSERDEHNNAAVRYYNRGYGFDLKEAVGRLQLKEMGDPVQMEQLYKTLQQGELVNATLIKGGKEIPIELTTDPKHHTLKMWDKDGVSLFMPGPKKETKYGEAPVDQKRIEEGTELRTGDALVNSANSVHKGEAPTAKAESVTHNATQVDKKKDLLPKNTRQNSLLPKNRVARGKGHGIA